MLTDVLVTLLLQLLLRSLVSAMLAITSAVSACVQSGKHLQRPVSVLDRLRWTFQREPDKGRYYTHTGIAS